MRVKEAGNLDELVLVRLHDEEGLLGPFVPSRLSARRDRHQSSQRLENVPRSFQSFTADGVEHHIHVLDGIFKARRTKVDHLLGAQARNEVNVARRCGGRHAGGVELCELYSEYPDSACATVDQDAFSGPQLRAVEQSLPGGQGANRNRRSLRVS